jgi:RNA-binding protein YhbY
MTQKPPSTIQLGKQGISDNFFQTLQSHFKDRTTVKIVVLKSACRDKSELKEIVEKILDGLGKNYTARVIGYTIALKKWRKERR